jgi:hypothetical protein
VAGRSILNYTMRNVLIWREVTLDMFTITSLSTRSVIIVSSELSIFYIY